MVIAFVFAFKLNNFIKIYFQKKNCLGDIETVKNLLELGANVNSEDRHKETPLMKAAFHGMISLHFP